MKTPQQILKEAADLIEQKGWRQHHYAADAKGVPVDALNANAVCFCASGAIDRAAQNGAGPDGSALAAAARVLVLRHIGGNPLVRWSIPNWNDDPKRTKEEVIAALRAASLLP